MVSCVVPGCNNYSAKTKKAGDTVSYFHIPLDHRKRAWLDRMRRTNLPPLENCHVCSEHFLPSCFEPDLRAQLTGQMGKRSLKADAIPSVFKYSHSPEEKILRLSSERRLQRQRHEEVSLSLIECCPELCYINGLV